MKEPFRPSATARSGGRRVGRRRGRIGLLAVLFAAVLVAGRGERPAQAQPTATPAPVTLACFDVATVLAACRAGAEAWAAETGRTARVVAATWQGRASLDRYASLLAIESPRIDVLQMPGDWLPSLRDHLAPFGIDEMPPAPVQPAAAGIPNALLSLAMQEGSFIALPQVLSLTVLYYRQDVLGEAPPTWAGLRAALEERTSLVGVSRDQLRGVVFGGATDRALTDVVLSLLIAYGAPPLVTEAGALAVAGEGILAAFTAIDRLVGTVIATESATLSSAVARDLFANGGAAGFLASSIFLDGLRNDAAVSPFLGVALPPAGSGEGGRRPALAEAFYLGVSRYSADLAAAASLARFLASEAWQRRAAVEFGLGPTVPALYRDEAVLAAREWFGDLALVLEEARVPPVAAFALGWIPATEAVGAATRALIGGEIDPAEAVARLGPALRLLVRPTGEDG